MNLRRLLFIVPLCLMLAACLEPTGPRLPDEEEGGDDPPPQNELVVPNPGH